MKKYRLVVLFMVAALCTAGCGIFGGEADSSSTSPTSPTTPSTPTTATAYIGAWQSSGTGAAGNTLCNNIDWQITGVNGNTVSGAFTATCAGNFQIVGTGTGTPNGSQLDWTAVGTASNSGVSCPFSLSGTATPQGSTALNVNYSGAVCGLAVAGTETLNKV